MASIASIATRSSTIAAATAAPSSTPSGTAFRNTNRRLSALVLIPRGFARGVATAKRARELGCDRMKPLELRHTVQGHAAGLDPEPLPDPVTEADECHVNAGENRSAG